MSLKEGEGENIDGNQILSEDSPLIQSLDGEEENMVDSLTYLGDMVEEKESDDELPVGPMTRYEEEEDGEEDGEESRKRRKRGPIQPDMGYPYFLAPNQQEGSACFQAIFQTFSTKTYYFILNSVLVLLVTLGCTSYLVDGFRCVLDWDSPWIMMVNVCLMPFYYMIFHVNFIGGGWYVVNFTVLIVNYAIMTSANILHSIAFRKDKLLIMYIYYCVITTMHFSFLLVVQILNVRAGIRGKRKMNKGPPNEKPRLRYRIHFMDENIFAFLLGYAPPIAVIFSSDLLTNGTFASDAFVHWVFVVYFFKFYKRRDFGWTSTICFGIYILLSINDYVAGSVNLKENHLKKMTTWTQISTMAAVLGNYIVVWALVGQNMFNNLKRIQGPKNIPTASLKLTSP